ncbi:uncharacterized protein LOC126835771 [Adelges cooleyi]|uniref:uncharacterized protein LOC126835771 n=1 Tax=Adelges cooleyi TaxID=133065 RepID=UPI0021808634|nr:uncharacterized protein LOC126835771 [Adelges cooleyi]
MNRDYSQSSKHFVPLTSKTKFSELAKHTTTAGRTFSAESIADSGYAEDRETRLFLETEPVVPVLPKMPDISKYLNRGKTVRCGNTLNNRSTIIKNYMNECAVTQKIDVMMTRTSLPPERIEVIKMPQSYYHKQLKAFADAMDPTPIHQSWIEHITEKSRTVCWKRTKVSDAMLDEVKTEYAKVMRKLQSDGIVKPIPSPYRSPAEEPQETPITNKA